MDTDFVSWLEAQLQERNWSQAELVRESGLDKQSIHYYLTHLTQLHHRMHGERRETPLKVSVASVFSVAKVLYLRNISYLTQSSKPPHAPAKIACALKLPVEEIYRAAGFLPRPPHINETIEEIMYEMEGMSEEDRQEVLAFVRMKDNLRRQ
jgi:hypothetical protein